MTRAKLSLVGALVLLVAVGCGDDDATTSAGPGTGGSGAGSVGGAGGGDVTGLTSSDKVDLLIVVDNSRSMADKQSVLSDGIGELLDQLIDPVSYGHDFDPVLDMHIGVISSSLGGHGSDACAATTNASENDKGQLINRIDTTGTSRPAATYNDGTGDLKFLVWDPNSANPSHQPQGEADQDTLIGELAKMVGGAGEVGCGFEAPLEAWYRFLGEPDPHDAITVVDDQAVLSGTDTVLLQQRANFLRPDSLLGILVLSDENDCSIRDGGSYYFAGQIYSPGSTSAYHLPKPRHQCAIDPNDECCASCGVSVPASCEPELDDCDGVLDPIDDHINVRCHDQKRRFGIDFLQPIARYEAGLTQSNVADRDGNLQPNPIFSDLQPDDDSSAIRGPSLVFMLGIVGVPWQDIARKDDDGNPDLQSGVQSGAELAANGTWDLILGDPSCYHTDAGCLPTDPLMHESIDLRSGNNPVTGEAIATASTPLGNAINGHDYATPARDDLQYACIFELPDPKDCATVPAGQNCDCSSDAIAEENPLCYNGTGYDEIQRRAKAYPGTRELQVLQLLGAQGAVGSVCPAQSDTPTGADFGYAPAMRTFVEMMATGLAD